MSNDPEDLNFDRNVEEDMKEWCANKHPTILQDNVIFILRQLIDDWDASIHGTNLSPAKFIEGEEWRLISDEYTEMLETITKTKIALELMIECAQSKDVPSIKEESK